MAHPKKHISQKLNEIKPKLVKIYYNNNIIHNKIYKTEITINPPKNLNH